MKKQMISIILIVVILTVPMFSYGEIGVNSKSALLMDFNTGEVIYSMNENEKLPPASVTKIMTLLLTMEAIESGKLKMEDRKSVV